MEKRLKSQSSHSQQKNFRTGSASLRSSLYDLYIEQKLEKRNVENYVTVQNQIPTVTGHSFLMGILQHQRSPSAVAMRTDPNFLARKHHQYKMHHSVAEWSAPKRQPIHSELKLEQPMRQESPDEFVHSQSPSPRILEKSPIERPFVIAYKSSR